MLLLLLNPPHHPHHHQHQADWTVHGSKGYRVSVCVASIVSDTGRSCNCSGTIHSRAVCLEHTAELQLTEVVNEPVHKETTATKKKPYSKVLTLECHLI